MEALQNGQTTSEGGIEGQSAVAASHAMIEKILSEEPRWQGECHWGSVGLGKFGLCGVPAPVQNFSVVNLDCGHPSWLIGVFFQIQRMCWETTRQSSVRNPPGSVVKVMPVPTTTIAKTEEEVQENTNTGTVVLGIVLSSWVVQCIGNLWCRRQDFDH